MNIQKYVFIYKFIFEKTQYCFMYDLIYNIYLIHMYKFMYKFIHDFDQLRLTLDAARDFGLGKSA